ncbi:cyclic lactone autoinducer peptide [Sedimentibacter hydroxybenzoicus DSM 7310]|uniref:Cyclic lactone autoinducer peptide n=1 Tax=Sedimentibacter hydroxybenzoicus DSM 7310 TaxID=1123245 RepID=A0A974BKU0_SEDHY|nr:cyclic lactone autoinducer peptide [Sedimentibacter hydroxybenzoicus]NYB75003.1 cyclic lactone autoinducer peptide [Sedimentibacter hydroxybenzoicus DSM 7310]
MQKHVMKLTKYLASFALMIVALNVNTSCLFAAHQPKLPSGATKLRKF